MSFATAAGDLNLSICFFINLAKSLFLPIFKSRPLAVLFFS